jgi:polysaccharide pyruvyl transferase WcaK-like protein
MVLGAVAELDRRAAGSTLFVMSGPNFALARQLPSRHQLADRHQFFGSPQSFEEELGLIGDFSRRSCVLVFGADVLDGHYGRERYARTFAAIELALRQGARVRVIGFSISRSPDAEAIEFFRRYAGQVQLFPRDPVSMRRLAEAGVSNLTLAADVAFLMPPAATLPDVVREFASAHDGPVIGVSLHAQFFERDCEGLTSLMAATFGELSRLDSWRFVCVPHHPTDVGHLTAMLERIEPGLRHRFCVLDTLPTAPVAKRVFASCTHVVTSRMHVAVAALSTGTAVTCFPYLGKFEGLFEHFGLSEGLLDCEQLNDPRDLAVALRERVADSGRMREEIGMRLAAVEQLARSNFEGLEPPNGPSAQ